MKILIAEDKFDIRFSLDLLFQSNNHTVETVVNGIDALHKIEVAEQSGQQFDLVIAEMNLPMMSGIELLGKLRAIGNDIKAVIFSDPTELDCDKYFMKQEDTNSVKKTVDARKILTAMDALLENDRLTSIFVCNPLGMM